LKGWELSPGVFDRAGFSSPEESFLPGCPLPFLSSTRKKRASSPQVLSSKPPKRSFRRRSFPTGTRLSRKAFPLFLGKGVCLFDTGVAISLFSRKKRGRGGRTLLDEKGQRVVDSTTPSAFSSYCLGGKGQDSHEKKGSRGSCASQLKVAATKS